MVMVLVLSLIVSLAIQSWIEGGVIAGTYQPSLNYTNTPLKKIRSRGYFECYSRVLPAILSREDNGCALFSAFIICRD
jgi:hypothetical protein